MACDLLLHLCSCQRSRYSVIEGPTRSHPWLEDIEAGYRLEEIHSVVDDAWQTAARRSHALVGARQEVPTMPARARGLTSAPKTHGSFDIFDFLCEDLIVNVLRQLMGLDSGATGLAKGRSDARAVVDMGAVLCTSRLFAAVLAGNPSLLREVSELRLRIAALSICRPPPRCSVHPNHNAPRPGLWPKPAW